METSAVEARKRGILAEEFRERSFSYSLGNKIILKHELFNIG